MRHRTASHRTAPHRTAPQRTAPHRTAPHFLYPARRMFNRPLKTTLPHISHCGVQDEHTLRHLNYKARQRQKLYSDQRRRAHPLKVQKGNQVIIRRRQLNKAVPRFNPQPYKDVDVNGSMITAQSQTDVHELTRNSSFTRRLETESATTSYSHNEYQSTESTPDADTETESTYSARSRFNRRKPDYPKDFVTPYSYLYSN